MNKKVMSILKKIYFHENGFYNTELDRYEHKIPSSVNGEALNLLKISGFLPNNFEVFEHDDSLERLIGLKKNNKLTLAFAKAMFLKGISGEFPRGRQTLMSYIYTKNLVKHEFEGEEVCEICGLPKKKTIDKTEQLYTYYLGHSWNEMPIHNLIELEEVLTYDLPKVTEEDDTRLVKLLDVVADAMPDETPGRLEKRIAKSKLLPKTDRYKRYGILLTLSECGVLPNNLVASKYDEFLTVKEINEASKKLKTSHRSDIVLPLGAWKGKEGVNYKRYREIFG
ncbi:hypothetical protein [Tenacibaculum maritimum]|uniref:hypothetical protein n=1 Tax=Tenacibaculum maritimum TaxID=107401 RepID=UPI00388D5BB6